MSLNYLHAVFTASIKGSARKLVLCAMANLADEEGCCYPSNPYLQGITSLNEKTIRRSIHELIARGYLEDTGERKGRTKQVIVYKIKSETLPNLVPFNKSKTTKITGKDYQNREGKDYQNREADTKRDTKETQQVYFVNEFGVSEYTRTEDKDQIAENRRKWREMQGLA